MPEKQSGPMQAEAFSAGIDGGIHGAFVFFGEEDYLKSFCREKIYRAVMAEGMEIFNYFPISFSPASGTKEAALDKLSDAVAAIPMMQDKKLIVVTDLAPAGLSKELLESLCEALSMASHSEDTVLVLDCRADELVADYKLEASPVYTKLAACATMVRFDLLTRGKLMAWAKRRFRDEGVIFPDEAAGLLCDLAAGRMMSLSGEIQKLLCYAKFVKGGNPPTIDETDVKRIASATTPDEIPFAMLTAAQSFRLSEMLAVLDTAREQREEPVAVLAKLSRIYLDMLLIKAARESGMSSSEMAKALKMKEFRVGKYVAALSKVPMRVIENAVRLAYETDKRLKSQPSDPWVLLDKMIVEIYAPKSLRVSEG